MSWSESDMVNSDVSFSWSPRSTLWKFKDNTEAVQNTKAEAFNEDVKDSLKRLREQINQIQGIPEMKKTLTESERNDRSASPNPYESIWEIRQRYRQRRHEEILEKAKKSLRAFGAENNGYSGGWRKAVYSDDTVKTPISNNSTEQPTIPIIKIDYVDDPDVIEDVEKTNLEIAVSSYYDASEEATFIATLQVYVMCRPTK